MKQGVRRANNLQKQTIYKNNLQKTLMTDYIKQGQVLSQLKKRLSQLQ